LRVRLRLVGRRGRKGGGWADGLVPRHQQSSSRRGTAPRILRAPGLCRCFPPRRRRCTAPCRRRSRFAAGLREGIWSCIRAPCARPYVEVPAGQHAAMNGGMPCIVMQAPVQASTGAYAGGGRRQRAGAARANLDCVGGRRDVVVGRGGGGEGGYWRSLLEVGVTVGDHKIPLGL
jgi:hypothetical protein